MYIFDFFTISRLIIFTFRMFPDFAFWKDIFRFLLFNYSLTCANNKLLFQSSVNFEVQKSNIQKNILIPYTNLSYLMLLK